MYRHRTSSGYNNGSKFLSMRASSDEYDPYFNKTIHDSKSGHVLYCTANIILILIRQWKVSGGDMYCSRINCTAIIIFCFDFQWKVKEGDMCCTATIIVCFGLTMEGSRRVAAPLLTKEEVDSCKEERFLHCTVLYCNYYCLFWFDNGRFQ